MKFSAVLLFASLAAVAHGKSKDEKQERRPNTEPLIHVVPAPEVVDVWGSKGGKGYYGGYYGSKGSKGGYYSNDDDYSCDSSPNCTPMWGNGVQFDNCCPKPTYPDKKCDPSPDCYGPYCCPTPEPNCYEICYEVEYGGKGGKGSKGGYDRGFYYGGKGGKGSKGGYYGSEEECEIICEDDHLPYYPPYYPPIRPPTSPGPNCHEVCYEVGGGGSKGGKGSKGGYYGGKGGKGSKGGYYEYDEECEWICYPPTPTADCREVCYEVGGGGSKGGKGGKSSGYYGSYYGGKGGKGGKGYYGFKNEECEWICDPVPTPSCDPSPGCMPMWGNGVQFDNCCPKPTYPAKPSYPVYPPAHPPRCDSSSYCYGYNCCPAPEPYCYEVCHEIEGGSKGGKGGKSGYYGSDDMYSYGGYYGGKGGKGGYYSGFEKECETVCE